MDDQEDVILGEEVDVRVSPTAEVVFGVRMDKELALAFSRVAAEQGLGPVELLRRLAIGVAFPATIHADRTWSTATYQDIRYNRIT